MNDGAPRLRPSDARTILADARGLHDQGQAVLAEALRRRQAAQRAYDDARQEVVRRALADMPISRLRETTQGAVRFGAIERAGFSTVAKLLDTTPQRLMQIQGVGHHSASQVIGAARQLERAMAEGLWLRFEVDLRPTPQGALLAALAEYEVAERAVSPLRDDLEATTKRLADLEQRARKTSSRLRMVFTSARNRDDARRALVELASLLATESVQALDHAVSTARDSLSQATPTDVWRDYESRVATYNGLLVEISGLDPDHDATQGHLPEELARRVHAHPLDTSLINVSLRGYQAFGAKFALLQKRAMLGDEMGLGKTIEALAAICHLSVKGKTHFLVVCPASVLVNWLHEIERHSELAAVRLHGADRERNFRAWTHRGGVGVTTFNSLRWLYEKDFDVAPALLVVDEAHYVKNPSARRTAAVRDFMQFAERTLFLTGTPLENRVDEFRTLIEHLQPNVARRVSALDGLAGAAKFRAAVAPVYLRRNQEDVLQELPPRIETEEWVELAGDDFSCYVNAVAEGNFMAMRQAAYEPASRVGAAKLARLADIVEEATANDRKIVIFSFFRRVLATIADVLDDIAVGPLTGSVPPTKRQELIDDFSASSRACALVSQIEAGGVGLNIQAASVVILAEPQWKPSVEEQAIARAHRMGQARPVDVHRLLATDSVDQRILEVLAEKSALFNEYVRRSALKEISPDAVDISDLQAAEKAVSIAEEERRIVEIERQRLGLQGPTDTEGGTSNDIRTNVG